jgi:hypothetical protein
MGLEFDPRKRLAVPLFDQIHGKAGDVGAHSFFSNDQIQRHATLRLE